MVPDITVSTVRPAWSQFSALRLVASESCDLDDAEVAGITHDDSGGQPLALGSEGGSLAETDPTAMNRKSATSIGRQKGIFLIVIAPFRIALPNFASALARVASIP
jgi:hypothetical protein